MAKLENRGFDPLIVEMMIKADVQDKNFLQNKDKMLMLKNKIDQHGYSTESLVWNEEEEIFEIMSDQRIKTITSKWLPLAEI
jgi:hypothetical protein